MFIIDPFYLFILITSLVVAGGAQIYMSTAFRKWGHVKNTSGLTGSEVAEAIIRKYNLTGVKIEKVSGHLSDHYDPRTKITRLSDTVYSKDTIVAMAVSAHELGHAQQHAQGSALIKMRNFLVPALTVSPQLSYGLIMFGLIFSLPGLFNLGILFYGLIVIFSLITLPVEFDASKRGLAMLTEIGYLKTEEDRKGSKQILYAAGSTYVAAAINALLQLLYYISLARR